MKRQETDRLRVLVQSNLRKYAKGRIRKEDLEDAEQEILGSILTRRPARAAIENMSAYISRAARNQVMNALEKERRRATDQAESELDHEAPAQKPSSILAILEQKHPQDLEFVERAVQLVDLLYRISLTRDNPNVTLLLCLDRTINALSVAAQDIENLKSSDLSGFGVIKFSSAYGNRIVRYLRDQTEILSMARAGIEKLPYSFRFPTFVLDAIPKLRADPVMLIIRVLYKKFKVGSGKHGTREMIGRLILELREREARARIKRSDIFSSVSEDTNFETLRKKVYKKSTDPLYDELATWICETCEAQR